MPHAIEAASNATLDQTLLYTTLLNDIADSLEVEQNLNNEYGDEEG
jgi:hypothetical protein